MDNNENKAPENETDLQNQDGAEGTEGQGDGAGETTQQQTPPPQQTRQSSGGDAPKKKTVEVDAETLERLVSGYEKLQQKVTDLEGAADVGRLARIQQARNEGKLVKNAKLSVFDNKIVLAWARVKDDVYFDEAGRLHEDQQVELYLDAGLDEHGKQKTEKTQPMSYRAFARLTTKVEGEVIGESKDKDGRMSYTVQLDNGREYTLPIVFIN